MKWFTREWTRGQLSDAEADAVPALYAEHLDHIEAQLSVGALDLARNLNVHDGRVKGWRQANKTIELDVVAGELQAGYQRILLTFEGSKLVHPTSLDDLDFANPRTEILYDEVDVTDSGAFEYRMLVWPDGEVAIRFDSVVVKKTAATAADW